MRAIIIPLSLLDARHHTKRIVKLLFVCQTSSLSEEGPPRGLEYYAVSSSKEIANFLLLVIFSHLSLPHLLLHSWLYLIWFSPL